MPIRKCLVCGKEFMARPNQKYCGSYKEKGTCAYKMFRKRKVADGKRWKLLNYDEWKRQRKEYRKKYIKEHPEWWKIQKEKMRKNEKDRRLKTRFMVFKRDGFTCQYCGRKSPEAQLEIDHKHPKSKGGSDSIDNYITSCRECNIGKGDAILSEFVNK